jgi:hypothetical protein
MHVLDDANYLSFLVKPSPAVTPGGKAEF